MAAVRQSENPKIIEMTHYNRDAVNTNNFFAFLKCLDLLNDFNNENLSSCTYTTDTHAYACGFIW